MEKGRKGQKNTDMLYKEYPLFYKEIEPFIEIEK